MVISPPSMLTYSSSVLFASLGLAVCCCFLDFYPFGSFTTRGTSPVHSMTVDTTGFFDSLSPTGINTSESRHLRRKADANGRTSRVSLAAEADTYEVYRGMGFLGETGVSTSHRLLFLCLVSFLFLSSNFLSPYLSLLSPICPPVFPPLLP